VVSCLCHTAASSSSVRNNLPAVVLHYYCVGIQDDDDDDFCILLFFSSGSTDTDVSYIYNLPRSSFSSCNRSVCWRCCNFSVFVLVGFFTERYLGRPTQCGECRESIGLLPLVMMVMVMAMIDRAARHGHQLNGKLSRLAQQEASHTSTQTSDMSSTVSSTAVVRGCQISDMSSTVSSTAAVQDCQRKHSKTKKKKKKKKSLKRTGTEESWQASTDCILGH